MQIKKFTANSMVEALKMVKKEFGSEAVILSARKKELERRFLGFPKTEGVEITAATDSRPIENKVKFPGMLSKYNETQSQFNRVDLHSLKRKNSFLDSFRSQAGNYMKKNRPLDNKITLRNREAKALYNAYYQMLDQDIDKDIALELIKSAKKYALPYGYLTRKGFKYCLLQILGDAGVAANRVKLGKENKKIISIIGPAGVGKTSIVAKLVAAAKTRKKRQKVAMITLDDNRIGAIAQFKLYAKIFGSPVKAVSSKKELKKCVDKFSDYNLIFIDTPGISLNNRQQILEAKDCFDRVHNIEYHLVLSAATNDKALQSIIEKFKLFNVNRLIFTKLDECITYGSILNQLYRTKIPVSYITNGQQIPEDIEVATIEKLADLILNERRKHSYLNGSPEQMAQNIIYFENMLDGVEGRSTDMEQGLPEKYISVSSATG